jgi:hypothetical protein
MRRCEVDQLDPTRTYWVPAVVSPHRDWAGVPGCRRGARFLIDGTSLRPARGASGDPDIPCFASRAACLEWIMAHRIALARAAPGAAVAPADLARWLLGLN